MDVSIEAKHQSDHDDGGTASEVSIRFPSIMRLPNRQKQHFIQVHCKISYQYNAFNIAQSSIKGQRNEDFDAVSNLTWLLSQLR